MEWLIIPVVVILGMMGGQFLKPLRRYGIPIAAILASIKRREKRKYWLISLMVVLSMGYGVDSKLGKLLGGRDWLVRWVYGLLVGGVVALAGFVYGIILMPIAFLFRCNFSFKIGKYDFIMEDFIRYSTLGFCIFQCIK